MAENNLKLNDNKTEFMTIGTQHTLSEIGERSISIGSVKVKASQSARNIGVVFDAKMDMKEQVNQVISSCYHHMRGISRIRRYLTTDAAEKLTHAFVTSRLDCNNALLYGLPDYVLKKLQLIQNHAARIISRKKKFDHITDTLISLHWLPVKFRIEYKILILMFKCIQKDSLNDKPPMYLADLLEPYLPVRSLRIRENKDFVVPQTRLPTYGDRAFSVCGPNLSNVL